MNCPTTNRRIAIRRSLLQNQEGISYQWSVTLLARVVSRTSKAGTHKGYPTSGKKQIQFDILVEKSYSVVIILDHIYL